MESNKGVLSTEYLGFLKILSDKPAPKRDKLRLVALYVSQTVSSCLNR